MAADPKPAGRSAHGAARAALAFTLLMGGLGISFAAPPVALASWEASVVVDFISFGGSGWVRSDDGSIACRWNGSAASGDCSYYSVFPDFVQSHSMTLTFDPDPGSQVCDDGCTTSDDRGRFITLTPSDPREVVTLSFQLQLHMITVDIQGSSAGVVTIDAPVGRTTTCSSKPAGKEHCWQVQHGTTITLIPSENFSYWAGVDCPVVSSGACTFTVTRSDDLAATFGKVEITMAWSGGGQICSPHFGGICYGELGSGTSRWIDINADVALEARADAGWRFKSWSAGPCAGQDNVCGFSATQTITITATFVRLATAAPPTPTPLATTKPTAKPAATPATSGSPVTAPTDAAPGATADPAPSPAGTTSALPSPAGPSPVGLASSAPLASPTIAAAAPTSSPGPDLVAAPAATGGLDPIVLVLLGVIVVLLLVVGYLLGTYRSARRMSAPDEPVP